MDKNDVCSLIMFAICAIAIAVSIVSYRLGVNDGFMVSKEPGNPGYRRAVKILQRYGKFPKEG